MVSNEKEFIIFRGKYTLNIPLEDFEFDKIVNKYKGDYRYRHLTSYNHLLHLIFVSYQHVIPYEIFVYVLRLMKNGFIILVFVKL